MPHTHTVYVSRSLWPITHTYTHTCIHAYIHVIYIFQLTVAEYLSRRDKHVGSGIYPDGMHACMHVCMYVYVTSDKHVEAAFDLMVSIYE
jgi:hypothetical protein